MQFHYGKAPVYYIDGVPGYKAGEWPGIKSCKFRNTRRIIQPKCEGIIFNEKENLLLPKKRKLPALSPEYEFKPCCRMVDFSKFDHDPKINSLRVIQPVFTQNKIDCKKKIYFDYIKERDKKEKEKLENMNLSKLVGNEIRLRTLIGFKKLDCNSLTNSELYKMRFNKKRDKLTLKDYEDTKINRIEKLKEKEFDKNYVKSLNNFDNKNINIKLDK